MPQELIFNLILIIIFILIGLGLGKVDNSFLKSSKPLSSSLVYFFSPCMIISSFLRIENKGETFAQIGWFFIITLVLQLLFILILFAIFHKKYDRPEYRILSAASILGNVGFFGQPLIVSLFPNEPIVAAYSSSFVISMNLIVFTLGVFLITKNKKFISIKSAFLNPTTISFLIAFPLFFFNVPIPKELTTSISFLGRMVTPVCMVTLGLRLSTMSFKEIFTSKIAYLTGLFKLIIVPLIAFLIVAFIPYLSLTFKISILVLFATPSGAIIVSLAELHECARKEASNAVLLTTLLSIITIPLIALFL